MKVQDIIFLLLFLFLISDGNSPIEPVFSRNLMAYEAEVAYRVLDTTFVDNTDDSPVVDIKDCPCKGTKKVKSPDGIAIIPCQCGDKCVCKKPQGSNIVTVKEEIPPFTYMFTADWCGYCVKFKTEDIPVLKKHGWQVGEDTYSPGDNLVIVNIDKNPTLFSQYKEKADQALPYFVVTKDNKKVDGISSYVNADKFSRWSNNLVNPAKSKTYKIVFGHPWVENGRNTTIEHLINEHGYTYEQLAPYANNHDALNRIHGYAHTRGK